MIDDKDEFTNKVSIISDHLLQEAQNLITLIAWDSRRWCPVIRYFMIKYAEDLDEAIAFRLGRNDVSQ